MQQRDVIPVFYRSGSWQGLREETLLRDKHICQYCGGLATTADHIVPRKKHGPDTLMNLVACCDPCNSAANGDCFETFHQKKAWILDKRDLLGRPLKAEETPINADTLLKIEKALAIPNQRRAFRKPRRR
jgi:5-methylcytosine-specific restriction endonuclease McrA